MSKRYWIAAIAFGLIALGSLGHAQDKPDDPAWKSESEEAPAYHLPFSVPVYIVEDKPAAEARERQEQEARQREKEDLVAQQGMNTATQLMAEYALLSTILGAFGTGLLVVTLHYTREANKAAQNAVEVTRQIGEAQVRAYLHLSELSAEIVEGAAAIRIQARIMNSGQTPARNVEIQYLWVAEPLPFREEWWEPMPGPVSKQSIGASGYTLVETITNEREERDRSLSRAQFEQVINGVMPFWFLVVVSYTDVFKRSFFTYERYRLAIKANGRLYFIVENAGRDDS